MAVFPVDINMQLTDDHLIDIFLIQWYTPFSASGYSWEKIPLQSAESKGILLENFKNWLLYFDKNTPLRPLFIVIPELSTPICHVDIFDQIAQEMNRPIVIIAGLEYLSWSEYHGLVQTMPDMDKIETRLKGGHENHAVNAAGIWIREFKAGSSGELSNDVKKFIQPKSIPCEAEATYLYHGQHVLLFRSSNQRPGFHLNFCVQICSDFNSDSFVYSLREECVRIYPEEQSPPLLDITFLLQYNENQEAEQIKRAIKAYFEESINKIETERGCLVFVNNANHTHGNVADEYGQSKFLFKFSQSWRIPKISPPPTFWFKDEKAHDHQAVILRESGPCFYWLSYKPGCLVSRVAGSGQSVPFPEMNAYCALIKDNSFEEKENNHRFVPIQPVCHWFHGELDHGEREVPSWISRQGNLNSKIAQMYFDSYKQGIKDWYQAIGNIDKLARMAVNTYLSGCNGNCDHDSHEKSNPINELEPQNWGTCISEAINRMMRVYTLLLLGACAFPGGTIKPKVEAAHHATDTDKFSITFMWGCGKIMPIAMIMTYLRFMKTHPLADQIFNNYLLVLINPMGDLNPKDLRRAIISIVCGSTPNKAPKRSGVPNHLEPPGDVVRVNREKGFRCICDHSLFGVFDSNKNKNENMLKRRLITVIKKHIDGV